MSQLPFVVLAIIFLVAAAAIWMAGIALTKTTDSLDSRFRWGDALGGLILLGITGSLPELAVTVSAALNGNMPVIIGNLIGGIAIQTLVIVIFDIALRGKRPLSYEAGSKLMFVESIFAAFIVALALLGTRVAPAHSVLNINPLSFGVLVAWVVGLLIINKARKNAKYNITAEDANPGRKHHERRAVENHPFYAKRSNAYVIGVFLLASLVTLVAGVLVERTGEVIAGHIGMSGGIFAATIIAFISSLPEISTGLESIFIGDNQLAISDIFGGNAFMPALFIIGDLIVKKPVLSFAGTGDKFLAVVGIVMTLVYGVAYLWPPKRRFLRMGFDSILQIAIYVLAVVILVRIQ